MEDIENYGIRTIVDLALNKVDPERNKSIHVSFDIDSLDSLEAPSTGTSGKTQTRIKKMRDFLKFAVRGGMTLREGIQLMEMIHQTSRLGALDVVEVNPSLGSEADVKRTVEAAIHVIAAALGHSRRGLSPRAGVLPLQTFPPKYQEI